MNVSQKNYQLRQPNLRSICSIGPRWRSTFAALLIVVVLLTINSRPVVAQSFYQQQRDPAQATGSVASQWQPPVSSRTNLPRRAPQTALQPTTKLVPLQPPRDIFTQDLPQRKSAVQALNTARAGQQPPTSPLNSFGNNSGNIARTLPTPRPIGDAFRNARQLNTVNRGSGGMFDSVSATSDDGRPKFAQANLEMDSLNNNPLGGMFSDSGALESSLATDAPNAQRVKSDFDVITANASDKLGEVKDWMTSQTSGLMSGFRNGGWQERLSQMFGGADVKRILGGLAVVIGGYLGLVWLLRTINPNGGGGIPREVLEVVGAVPLNNRQQLQLVRLGSKLLLMIHSAEGTQRIAEITDPAEVDHLLELCGGRSKKMAFGMGPRPSNQASAQSTGAASPSADTVNQLLRALEKNQVSGHAFEA